MLTVPKGTRMYSEISAAVAPSLADVQRIIGERQGISPTKRRDLLSALNRFANLAGMSLADLPIDFRKLRLVFLSIRQAATIGEKSLANIRSDLKKAVLLSGLHPASGSDARRVLSPSWRVVWEPLTEKRLRVGLTRFLKYCSIKNVGPEHVSDATLEAFFTELEEHTLARKVLDLRREIPTLWNRACKTAPNWPQQRLTIPPSRRREKNLPFADLPSGFNSSLSDLLKWCARGAPFEISARAKPMAEPPSTTLAKGCISARLRQCSRGFRSSTSITFAL
jgi:hypothetical protein